MPLIAYKQFLGLIYSTQTIHTIRHRILLDEIKTSIIKALSHTMQK